VTTRAGTSLLAPILLNPDSNPPSEGVFITKSSESDPSSLTSQLARKPGFPLTDANKRKPSSVKTAWDPVFSGAEGGLV